MSAAATPSRRACLFGAAAATVASGGAAAMVAPAVVSSEITAAIAAYWARKAEDNAPGADNDLIDLRCDEMDAAAARLAALPCRSLADLAANCPF